MVHYCQMRPWQIIYILSLIPRPVNSGLRKTKTGAQKNFPLRGFPHSRLQWVGQVTASKV